MGKNNFQDMVWSLYVILHFKVINAPIISTYYMNKISRPYLYLLLECLLMT